MEPLKPKTRVCFVAEGDLLKIGLGLCADPQDPRLQYRQLCPSCPNNASALTHTQVCSFGPVLVQKFPEIQWEVVPIEDTGNYWIMGHVKE